jgi:hypothetical protein
MNKLPKFLRKIKQRARRGFVIYLIFQCNKGIHYIIENKNYLQTFRDFYELIL